MEGEAGWYWSMREQRALFHVAVPLDHETGFLVRLDVSALDFPYHAGTKETMRPMCGLVVLLKAADSAGDKIVDLALVGLFEGEFEPCGTR